MRYSDFADMVRTHLEDHTEDTFTDHSISRWLELGYRSFFEMTRDHTDVIELTVQPGISRYEKEPRSIEVVSVVLDGQVLERVSFGSLASSAGYALTADEIVLYPTPTAEGTLTYYRKSVPVPPVSGDDEIPDRALNAMLNFVLAKAFEQIERFDNSTWYLSRFAEDVDRAKVTEIFNDNAGTSREPVQVA